MKKMFARVIDHLQRIIRNKLQLANDTTGVLTQFKKDEARADAAEYELAVKMLANIEITEAKAKYDEFMMERVCAAYFKQHEDTLGLYNDIMAIVEEYQKDGAAKRSEPVSPA
jgi:hypothetical protein